MSDTRAARLKTALDDLFPQLSSQVRQMLAEAIVRFVDKALARKWKLELGFDLGALKVDRTTPVSRALRGFRENAELSQEDVAKRAEWSQSKVTRMESGDVSVSAADVMAFLRICGIRSQRIIQDTLTLAREDRARRRNN